MRGKKRSIFGVCIVGFLSGLIFCTPMRGKHDIKNLYHGAKTDGECKVFDFAKKFSHGHILCSEKKENSKKCRKDKKLVE